MCNNFQALEIYVQANIASCVLGRPKCFRRPKTTYRHPTLQSRVDMMFFRANTFALYTSFILQIII